MEAIKNGTLKLFDVLIEAAPVVDMSTRCGSIWGEPEYPEDEK